jgi:hypothetical protein
MKIKFKSTDTTNKFNIFALRPKFRKSYRWWRTVIVKLNILMEVW